MTTPLFFHNLPSLEARKQHLSVPPLDPHVSVHGFQESTLSSPKRDSPPSGDPISSRLGKPFETALSAASFPLLPLPPPTLLSLETDDSEEPPHAIRILGSELDRTLPPADRIFFVSADLPKRPPTLSQLPNLILSRTRIQIHFLFSDRMNS